MNKSNELNISSEDIRLILSSRSKGRYANLTQMELETYSRVSKALEGLGELLKSQLSDPDKYVLKTTSGFNVNSGVRGGIPKDLWFSLSLIANAEKLVSMPQLFMIVSDRGIEFGYAASVSPRDFSSSAIREKVKSAAPIVFENLPSPSSPEIAQLQDKIDASGNWYFRKKHRLTPNQSDFSNLAEWIEYLKSDIGEQNAAGSISKYFSSVEIDQQNIVEEIMKLPSLFETLIDREWNPEITESEPKEDQIIEHNTNILPRIWIEKTLVKNREHRETGPNRLGEALWSPQSSKNGAKIYGNMLRAAPDDIVLHLIDNSAFVGISKIAQTADTNFEGLPGTEWEGQPAYRVQLFEYKELAPILHRDKILENNEFKSALMAILENHSDEKLFYNRKLELNQGAYLTAVPPELLGVLNSAYSSICGEELISVSEVSLDPAPIKEISPKYEIEDADKQLFVKLEDIKNYLDIWENKKNMILQGAPGVGKSFVARHLAYALIGRWDDDKVETVQFHQSYSYEDFVQGYRPNGSQGFDKRDGPFVEFCNRAQRDPDNRYVFIIDEINRGNLSKIFGELMLLIEHDKRSPEWKTRLAYADQTESGFYVPKNVFILGMMNTADRSLSLVDYALRRRFSFVTMGPLFGSLKFKTYLIEKGVPEDLVARIAMKMDELNRNIEDDRTNLGPGFQIGHSFFTPTEYVEDTDLWYKRIVNTEIYPLLMEYWFDEPDTADSWRDRLLN